jgi:cyclopropane fatty-acyl-phospholipid synthase-like methyltransferase
MNNIGNVEELYNANHTQWSRNEKTSLSDFTARPKVFELLGNLKGKTIADLGCGEGYCSRNFLKQGASKVIGVDISEEMISLAKKSITLEHANIIKYFKSNLAQKIPDEVYSADIYCSIFMFNYMTISETVSVLKKIKEKSLVSNPRLVFTLPHPFMPFMSDVKYPFYFETHGKDYFEAEGLELFGSIYTTTGGELLVRNVHKTFESIINALSSTGWQIRSLQEIRVTEDLLNSNPKFFGPIKGIPLHILIDANA